MKKLTIREKIYIELKNDIIYGKVAPGQSFLESDLVERFKCSRAPIREALQQLKSERYLESGNKKSATIPRLSLKKFEEIFDVRMALECYAFENISNQFNKIHLKNIIQLQDKMEKNSLNDDYIAYVENNKNFHLAFAKILNNETLQEYINDLINRVNVYHPYINAFGNMSKWVSEHSEIIGAIRKADFHTAKSRLRNHLKASKKAYIDIIQRLPGY
jgi:DNA-binding GntR family transcriptional regulator